MFKTNVIKTREYVFIVFVLIFVYIVFQTNIKRGINKLFFDAPIDTLSLSAQQKLDDFDYLYNVIITSMPMMEDHKKLYGFNFEDRKDYYKSLIADTKNDFEFFCVLDAIIQDIPSFHTDLIFPDSDEYKSLSCYNINHVLAVRGIDNYANYWENLIKEQYSANEDIQFAYFKYLEGKYVFISPESSDVYNFNNKSILKSINGESADSYIINNVSVSNLYYDFHYDKPCRDYIVLNDKLGKEVEVELENENGELITRKLYIGPVSETLFRYRKILVNNNSNYNDSILFHNENNIAYLKIDYFSNYEGKDLEQKLNNTNCENIIIDLRDNSGGYPDYIKDYIYPFLFDKNININNKWYMIDSQNNKKVFDSIFQYFILKFKNDNLLSTDLDNKQYVSSTVKRKYKGLAKNKKNVYILISHNTGSAADGFVALVKDNNLGTIIGENTSGEGLMKSYIADYLPNSKLVYIYMHGKAFNKDGTDNSTYGTSPHKYVSLKADNYLKMLDMEKEGINIYEFNNRLKWDNVLSELVDQINAMT